MVTIRTRAKRPKDPDTACEHQVTVRNRDEWTNASQVSLMSQQGPPCSTNNYLGVDNSNIPRCNLRGEQENDSIVGQLYRAVKTGKKSAHANSGLFLKDGILFGRHNGKMDSSVQLVVPRKYWAKILQLAHDDNLAGHSSIRNTKQRIMHHFYWPQINKTVAQYVRECHTCQRKGSTGKNTGAPLQSVEVLDTQFKKVAIHLIGPLPKESRAGNKYILTVVDTHNHWL